MISVDPTIIFVIFLVALIAYVVGKKMGEMLRDKYWEKEVEQARQDAVKRSRAVLGGQFSEQLAPYLPEFPYSPTECRFIGKPVDFIVFKGMDAKSIKEIVFVEVKSGKSVLSGQERALREAVVGGRVTWFEYQVPEGVTTADVRTEQSH